MHCAATRMQRTVTRMRRALVVPRFEVNKQNTKRKLSSAFFSLFIEIQDVRELKVSGNFYVVHDNNLNRECYDKLNEA